MVVVISVALKAILPKKVCMSVSMSLFLRPFSNGWIKDDDGTIFIYYAASDTRLHVAKTSVAQLIDYCKNTPADGLRSDLSVAAICKLVDDNKNAPKA